MFMNTQGEVEVSVVIVCMNNVNNLNVCLNSIKLYTNISYEVLVVAYLFSKDNLSIVKKEYPWVHFIESNEIRGFSENNNLALRKARGKYCFVLNDDTEIKTPVIDTLFYDMEKMPEDVAVLSPMTLNGDGTLQSCGRPKHTMWTYIGSKLRLWNEKIQSPYTNKKGLFKSYDIVGAAFLIKTAVFRKFGWFDERYFFCPEDIALSSSLNKNGYSCYVNADVSLIHYNGGSNKSITFMRTATAPAAQRGALIFYSSNSTIKYCLIVLMIIIPDVFRMIWHYFNWLLDKENISHRVYAVSFKNVVASSFSHLTPKEIFIKYYSKVNCYENN